MSEPSAPILLIEAMQTVPEIDPSTEQLNPPLVAANVLERQHRDGGLSGGGSGLATSWATLLAIADPKSSSNWQNANWSRKRRSFTPPP
jgi:hypothetical protein